jgi:hypothetical protein
MYDTCSRLRCRAWFCGNRVPAPDPNRFDAMIARAFAGVPYSIVMCFMCKSLWSILSEEYNKEHGIIPKQYNSWRTGIIDVLDYPTFRRHQVRSAFARV